MSEKEKTGRCRVVRWRLEGKSSLLQDFFQVLPWRWKAEKVKEYLYSLYYNSPTRPVAERTDWINSKVRTGLLVIEEQIYRSLMMQREMWKSCLTLNRAALDLTLREARSSGIVQRLR